MAAYRYKLETLLMVRRNREEQCRQHLAHELFVLENHKRHLRRLKDERAALVDTLEKARRRDIQAAMYGFYVEAIGNKDRMIAFQHNAIAAQERVVAQARQDLMERVKEKKIVERLKEKDFLDWQREQARREQNENDEQAVLRHGRAVLRHGRAVLRHGRAAAA